MIFSVVRELHRLTIQTVLYMACNRRLISVKKIFMVSALCIWWILTLCGGIEEIRKDTDVRLRSSTEDLEL